MKNLTAFNTLVFVWLEALGATLTENQTSFAKKYDLPTKEGNCQVTVKTEGNNYRVNCIWDVADGKQRVKRYIFKLAVKDNDVKDAFENFTRNLIGRFVDAPKQTPLVEPSETYYTIYNTEEDLVILETFNETQFMDKGREIAIDNGDWETRETPQEVVDYIVEYSDNLVVFTGKSMRDTLEEQIIADALEGDTTVLAELLTRLEDYEIFHALSEG